MSFGYKSITKGLRWLACWTMGRTAGWSLSWLSRRFWCGIFMRKSCTQQNEQ